MRRLAFFMVFTLLIFCIRVTADTTVNLKLFPEKDRYTVGERVTLLLSYDTTEEGLTAHIYIVLTDQSGILASIGPGGTVSGELVPYKSDVLIRRTENETIITFNYPEVLGSGRYSLYAAIVDANTSEIKAIYGLRIPPSEENRGISKWNPVRTVWGEGLTPMSISCGGNYVHVVSLRGSGGLFYTMLNREGVPIVSVLALPYSLSAYYPPAVVGDDEGNAYVLVSTSQRYIEMVRIGKDGSVNTYRLFDMRKLESYRVANMKAAYSNGTIYAVGEVYALHMKDPVTENDLWYHDSIVLFAVDTQGTLLLSPSPIAGRLSIYSKGHLIGESHRIYAQRPFISANGDGSVDIFWSERDETLHTQYVLRWTRYKIGSSSPVYTLADLESTVFPGLVHSFYWNNATYVAFTKASPGRVFAFKLSDAGEMTPQVKEIAEDDISYSRPFIFGDRLGNLDVLYYKGAYNYEIRTRTLTDDLSEILGDQQVSVPSGAGDYVACADALGNLHLAFTDAGVAKHLYYTNTALDYPGSDKADLVIPPVGFNCTPSATVDIGSSITCSFKVLNVSNLEASGRVKVVVNGETLLDEGTGEIDPYTGKSFSFTYAPQDPNTPEEPPVLINVVCDQEESSTENNEISPAIKVRPLPETASFRIAVYDETYDKEHNFAPYRLSSSFCRLYDESGGFISAPSHNRFTDVPIGPDERHKRSYRIVCTRDGYNEARETVFLWRDSENPYRVRISPREPVKIYMNRWGSYSVSVMYRDQNGEPKPLDGYRLRIYSGLYDRVVDRSTGNVVTINDVPEGTYNVVIEKEGYEPIVLTSERVIHGQTTARQFFANPTVYGTLVVKVKRENGETPPLVHIEIKRGNSVLKRTSTATGEYTVSLESGSYAVIAYTCDDDKTTQSTSVRAGLTKEVLVELGDIQLSGDLASYAREEEVGVVTYPVVAEWPGTPLSDDFKVSTLYGVFNIKTTFTGAERDGRIVTLNKMVVRIKGLGAYNYEVSSTWEPSDLVDLPENVELAKTACEAASQLDENNICRFPLALVPEITLRLAGYQGRTLVNADRVVVKDDLGNVLLDKRGDWYSDTTWVFNIDKVLAPSSKYIIAEIYAKVGEEDPTNPEEPFKDIDVLLGSGKKFIKMIYIVPRQEPEYGWYYVNPMSGEERHIASTSQWIFPSNIFHILKYRPYKPYTFCVLYRLNR